MASRSRRVKFQGAESLGCAAGISFERLARSIALFRSKFRFFALKDLYEGGYTSYLEVLDAERRLFNAQLQQSLQDQVLAQIVSLYKAPGYGWTPAAPPPAADSATPSQS